MKLMKYKWLGLAGVIALLAFSGSCFLFIGGNSAPTVTLSADSTTIYGGETITITADAYDIDGDSLFYEWFVDGVEQTTTSSTMEYIGPAVTSSTSVTITCTVSDNIASVSDTITLTVIPGIATLVVNNTSSYSIWYLYVALPSSSSWGNDRLGSSTISPNSTFTLYNIPSGAYKLRAETYSGEFWQRLDQILTNGSTLTWTLID